jgi:hypothetical protein
MLKCTKLKQWTHHFCQRFPQGKVRVIHQADLTVLRVDARQFEARAPAQEVTALAV